MRALVATSQATARTELAAYLGLKGYTTDCIADGVGGLHLLANNHYDLIIADTILPNLSGIEMCRLLRNNPQFNTPIIMLAVSGELNERLASFSAGADDCIERPYALPEIAARADAMIKRIRGSLCREIKISDLAYNLDTLIVTRAAIRLKINPVGLKLLELLMRRSPSVVPRDVIEEKLWGDDLPHSDSLRSHIHWLRQAIDGPFSTPLLHTVRGIGYRIAAIKTTG